MNVAPAGSVASVEGGASPGRIPSATAVTPCCSRGNTSKPRSKRSRGWKIPPEGRSLAESGPSPRPTPPVVLIPGTSSGKSSSTGGGGNVLRSASLMAAIACGSFARMACSNVAMTLSRRMCGASCCNRRNASCCAGVRVGATSSGGGVPRRRTCGGILSDHFQRSRGSVLSAVPYQVDPV